MRQVLLFTIHSKRNYSLAIFLVFFLFSSLDLKAQVNLDSALISYWPFNGNAIDETGNTFGGTVFGAVPTTDRCEMDSSAYEFDGIDDEIEFPSSFAAIVDTFSIGAWVYKTEHIDTEYIFSSNSQDINYSGIYLSIDLDTNIRVWYGDGNGAGPNNRRTKVSDVPFPLNEWVYIMAVVNGPQDMEIYINCENAGGYYDGTGGPLFNSFNTGLAGRTRHYPSYFNGKIDELRLYNRALTLDEVQEFCVPLVEVMLPNDTLLCQGETLEIGLPGGTYTYVWQDSTIGPNYTINSAGTYWVVASDGFCSASDSITVSYSDGLTVDLGEDMTICEGEQILLSAQNDDASYLWNDNSTESTLLVTEAGEYWVEVTDNCSTEMDTILIDLFDFPDFSLGEDTVLCGDQVLFVEVNIPDATYSWQDNSTNSNYTIINPGLYWVDVTLENCVSTDSILVEYSEIGSVFLGNDITVCQGEEVLLTVDATNANYLWSDQSTESFLNVTESGTYWVEVSDNCTSESDTIDVLVNPTPFVQLAQDDDTLLCAGQSLTYLFNYPGASFLWQDSSTANSYTIDEAGDYWVEAVLGECSSSDFLEVSYSLNTPFDLGNDTSICDGDVLVLNIWKPNMTFLWSDGVTSALNTITEAGTYWVQAIDDCAINTDTIVVGITELPFVDIGSDTSVCLGEEFYLDAFTPNATYFWQDSTTNATMLVDESDTYWVEITVGSCSNIDVADVELYDCEAIYDISNVFTPNGDGINDKFSPYKLEYSGPSTLRIYSRWGLLMYEGKTVFGGWDGTFNNNDCPEGTYYWFIESEALKNTNAPKKGYLTLLRGEQDN